MSTSNPPDKKNNSADDSKEESEKEELTRAERQALRHEKREERKALRKKRRAERSPWHPLNILWGIGVFFKTLFQIIFFPYVYAFWKIRDTFIFLLDNEPEDLNRPLITAEEGEELPRDQIDEKGFLRSLPMFYFIAGALGGLIGIFVSLDFMDAAWEAVKDFFLNFSWEAAWQVILDILYFIFVTVIFNAIYYTVYGIWWLIRTVFGWVFSENFWIPLVVLVGLGILVVIIIIVINEAEWAGVFIKKLRKFFKAVVNFPKTLWNWLKQGYINFQTVIAQFTYGKKSLDRYTKNYFYRIIIYSSFVTLWIIVSTFIVIVYAEYAEVFQTPGLVYPIGLVVIGIFNGVLFLAFISWFVRTLSKDRYLVEGAEKAQGA
ncbi:MAG: hypothetical protein GF308_12920 [Candidatus Heimdallarchaeota archaeon]|nr:hypothetical protein [Candidatus Heimdallarchaeota archaeon]